MIEALADHDDALLEQLIETDDVPESTEIYRHLAREMQNREIVPVLLGAATRERGVRRLLKALRHEAPGLEAAIKRRKVGSPDAVADSLALSVFRVKHQAHSGRMGFVRLWSGHLEDGQQLGSVRLAGCSRSWEGRPTKSPARAQENSRL